MPIYSSADLRKMRESGRDQTDLARVRAMTDDDIPCDEDAPEMTDEEFRRAVLWLDDGNRISFALDPDVRDWLAPPSGRIFQLNEILRKVMRQEAVKS